MLDDNLYRRQFLDIRKAIKIYEDDKNFVLIIDNREIYFGKLRDDTKYYYNKFIGAKQNNQNENYPIIVKSTNVIYAREKLQNKIFNIEFFTVENHKSVENNPKFFKKDKFYKIYTKQQIESFGKSKVYKIKISDDSILWTDLNGNFMTNKI